MNRRTEYYVLCLPYSLSCLLASSIVSVLYYGVRLYVEYIWKDKFKGRKFYVNMNDAFLQGFGIQIYWHILHMNGSFSGCYDVESVYEKTGTAHRK